MVTKLNRKSLRAQQATKNQEVSGCVRTARHCAARKHFGKRQMKVGLVRFTSVSCSAFCKSFVGTFSTSKGFSLEVV